MAGCIVQGCGLSCSAAMARAPIAGCQVSLHFRVAQGKRQGLSERKGRGGQFGKVLCHQVGLGLVIWVWFTLAAMHSPWRLARESLSQCCSLAWPPLVVGCVPKACSSPFIRDNIFKK